MVRPAGFLVTLGAMTIVALGPARAGEADWQGLLEQNRKLQEQVQAQQKIIDGLSAQMDEVRRTGERQEQELRDLQQNAAAPAAGDTTEGAKLRISGEAGLAFFRTGPDGQFPNSEFRVDDAKLFVEAQVLDNVYAVSEVDLLTREASDNGVYLASFFAEFEDLAARWGAPGALNLRVGRFAIPLGEEYQVRGVMDNPLISHSVADPWGFDNGVEIYGGAGRFSYVAAVQDGGANALHDFTADKAVTVRAGFAPASWLHVSASAMRTGDLSAKGDALSALWFGGAFFRAIGSAATQTFHANLYEVDASGRWPHGRLTAAAGWVDYGDDDPAADNARRLSYWSAEGLVNLGERLYGAVRYSEIRAPQGYPLAGLGNTGAYFYNPLAPWTEELSRLSFGFGYRLGPPLVLKCEYSFERGRLLSGVARDHEDLLATEVGLRF